MSESKGKSKKDQEELERQEAARVAAAEKQAQDEKEIAQRNARDLAAGEPPAPPRVDLSTTRVPTAVGVLSVEQAKADLAANPGRTSVLSKDGHVVREL